MKNPTSLIMMQTIHSETFHIKNQMRTHVSVVHQLIFLICLNENHLFLFFGLLSMSHSPNHLIASFSGNFVLHNSSNPVIKISSVDTVSISMAGSPEVSRVSKYAQCSMHIFSIEDSRTVADPLDTNRIEWNRSVRLETWRVTQALVSW